MGNHIQCAQNYNDLSSLASALGASGGLRKLKNIISSTHISVPANESRDIDSSLSGIIIISNEGSVAGTIIAAAVYGYNDLTDIAGLNSISGISLSKPGMGNIKITNSNNSAASLYYTFISSGSVHNIP